ncbi:hypothetical protein [Halarcobacter sp.]|uniref:hypothetical protein n=1 Tax=Halarcobacter sp. TaxID=2321133 RepID=UPI0029F48A5F|nr:hypothetical protein [Halarcobacter sp.]
MKKPAYISHYLVLKDLIEGKDVRMYSDTIFYLTSRIENVKCDLVKEGIEFIEDISKETTYSYYKPYILVPSESNITKAKKLLEIYSTKKVLNFIEYGRVSKNNHKQNPTKTVDTK